MTEAKTLHLDGEPLTPERLLAASRPCVRHCTVCEGSDHHWLDDCADEGDSIHICKHCDAWMPYDED